MIKFRRRIVVTQRRRHRTARVTHAHVLSFDIRYDLKSNVSK